MTASADLPVRITLLNDAPELAYARAATAMTPEDTPCAVPVVLLEDNDALGHTMEVTVTADAGTLLIPARVLDGIRCTTDQPSGFNAVVHPSLARNVSNSSACAV